MIRLTKIMRYNGQVYELLRRSDKVALYSVDGGRRYEVTRIYILPKESILNMMYRERESISNDKQFMRDGSRYCTTYENGLAYFDKLNKEVGGITEEMISPTNSDNTGELISGNTNEPLIEDSGSTLNGNSMHLITLPDTFKKNGILYKTMMRNDTVILFALYDGGKRVGFEVSNIKILPEQEKFGRMYPRRETLPSDRDFGLEGSRAFFPNEYERAVDFFEYLSKMLLSPSGDVK